MQKDLHHSNAMPQVKAEIYFGLGKPDETYITTGEADAFLREIVAATFPGFTADYAKGFWKGKPEPMLRVMILAEDSGAMRTGVRWIAEKFKTQFAQEAVAYSFTPCEFTLNCWPFGPVTAYHKEGKGY